MASCLTPGICLVKEGSAERFSDGVMYSLVGTSLAFVAREVPTFTLNKNGRKSYEVFV